MQMTKSNGDNSWKAGKLSFAFYGTALTKASFHWFGKILCWMHVLKASCNTVLHKWSLGPRRNAVRTVCLPCVTLQSLAFTCPMVRKGTLWKLVSNIFLRWNSMVSYWSERLVHMLQGVGASITTRPSSSIPISAITDLNHCSVLQQLLHLILVVLQ